MIQSPSYVRRTTKPVWSEYMYFICDNQCVNLCPILFSLVSLYEKMYGPLPYNKDGTELSNILTELPLEWTIDKKDITNTFISIQTAQTFSSQGE